jgi:hypothetical protein
MASLKLHPSESVLVVGKPPIAVVWPKYLFTAGLYGLWRRRQVVVLTDQRVIMGKGIMSRRERSIPIRKIDGAAYKRRGLSAYCELGIPDKEAFTPVTRLGPLSGSVARRFVEEIEART